MFFLVFFFFKKNRLSREKTCKEVELMERTQQRIKLKQLKVILYEYHERRENAQVRREKKEKERKGTRKAESQVT